MLQQHSDSHGNMHQRHQQHRPRRRSASTQATVVVALLVVLAFYGDGLIVSAETLQCNVSSTDQESLERWSPATGLTFSRDSHAAAVFQDKIWVVGGVSTSYYTKRLEQTTTRSDVISSGDGETWKEVLEEAPFRRRFGHTLTAFTGPSDHKERLVLLGGFSPEPATDVWTSTDGSTWVEVVKPSPWAGRGYHCTVVFNTRLWIMGGSPMNNDVWSTDSVLGGSWQQQTDVPWSARSAHSCTAHKVMANVTLGEASVEEFIFVMGGWDAVSMRDVWRMDTTGTWTQVLALAPWAKRAWHSVVSFDSRTNGDVEQGPRLWLLGGGLIGKGVEKMHPYWDVWFTRNGSVWTEASSDSSGVSTADWSMITARETQTCMGKWGQAVVAFRRAVPRSYYCSATCKNEANTTSLANQIIPVCNPDKSLPDPPTQKTILVKSSSALLTRTLYPDGCGLCYGSASERYVNATSVPALFLIAGNVGTQKVKDVFFSNDAMLCEKNGVICSNIGTCTLGGTCLCVSGKTGQFCDKDSAFTVVVDGNCFPPSARVVRHDGTESAIGDVAVGDQVLTMDPTSGRASFSTVYYLPHDNTEQTDTGYIRVRHKPWVSTDNVHSEASKVLDITPLHLLYIVPRPWRHDLTTMNSSTTRGLQDAISIGNLHQLSAQELQVGDLVVVVDAAAAHGIAISRVVALEHVVQRGAVTLYTTTGNLFVDGVLCSNFADLYPAPSSLPPILWSLVRVPHRESTYPNTHVASKTMDVHCHRDALPFALFGTHRLLFTLLPYPATAQLLRLLMDYAVLPQLRLVWPLHTNAKANGAMSPNVLKNQLLSPTRCLDQVV